MDPKSIYLEYVVAFYRHWAIIVPTFGGLGRVQAYDLGP